MDAPDLATAQWRISSYSAANGTCVEVGTLLDGRIAVRNSNYRDAGVVLFSPAEIAAWIDGVKAGEFDDLRC
ncbi:MAG: DUF397 domain-containing protein [Pseudonocardiaceae bacterium]